MTYAENMDALRDSLAAVAGAAIVERFVLVTTTINADAEQTVQIISDCEHAWQVLGLLAHATEYTKHVKYHQDDDT